MAEAAAPGSDRATLEVRASNTAALALYERARVPGRRPGGPGITRNPRRTP